MRRMVIVYFIMIFVLASLIGGSVLTTYSQFVAEGPLRARREVVIPAGMGLRQMADFLKKEGIITSSSIFVIGVKSSGNEKALKAGEYSIPRGASAKMVMMILVSGNTHIRRIVIPEGLTSYEIVALLDKAPGLVGKVEYVPKSGSLLPETYHYSYGDTKEGLIARMQAGMTRTLDELWEKRAEGLPFKNPKEALVMASIVEKETSLARERAHIASVFINRLEKNMRLQSDPTVIFALTEGGSRGEFKRRLTYDDLKYQHPYNTYVIYGLPRLPICNPGRKAIEAVLHPEKTNDIYFVADGTGGHVFAPTYQEHQQNVKKWRQIVRARRQARREKTTPAPKTAKTVLKNDSVISKPIPKSVP